MLTKIMCWFISCHAASITIDGQPLSVDILTEGHGIIWGMEFVSDDKLLFTTRSGQIKLLDLNSKTVAELKHQLKVLESGQGGLLDIKKHPSQPYVYVTYSKAIEDGNATTVLARAKYDGKTLGRFQDIFTAKPGYTTRHHYGSRVAFDDKGFLFISIGDRGRRDLAQSLETHNGKVLRLNDDGSTPKDNPFYTHPTALKEIYSYGHRNIQGMVFAGPIKTLFAMEHGPRGGDEINRIEAGKNYGWPVITYGKEYGTAFSIGEGTEKKGMLQPLKYYVPSIAPSGLDYYDSGQIKGFATSLLSGAMAKTHLNQVVVKDGQITSEKRHLEERYQRVRDVQVAPDQSVFVSTDSGEILRISAAK